MKMKNFYVLALIIFLASCGSVEQEVSEKEVQNAKEEVTSQIESELNEIVKENLKESEKVVRIEHRYSNPQQQVILDIQYTLDSSWKIEDIDVASPNYEGIQKTGFDNAVKKAVIGLTLQEIDNIDTISGSSLTTEAFKQAIREQHQ